MPKNQLKPPERVATGSNQVWCWDITYLRSPVRGLFYYAYVIIDVWDRSIVKWTINLREDEALALELFQEALRDNKISDVLFVHSDNGHPMKGITLLAFFEYLGIVPSRSRPRVSDDNPFIESWFKTLKHSISYPGRFKSIEGARAWFGEFVHQYNTEHLHSGLQYMTPLEVRNGNYTEKAERRNAVMREAKERYPKRWRGSVKQISETHIVALNPTGETRVKLNASELIHTKSF